MSAVVKLVPLLAALAPLALLAGCGGDKNDNRTARGEVLEGTISNSILPLETVRSQPPLAKVTGEPGKDGATPDTEATDAAGEGDDAVAPAGEPSVPAEETDD